MNMASLARGLASQHRFTDDPDLELCLNAGYAAAIAASYLLAHTDKHAVNNDLFALTRCWQRLSKQSLSMDLFLPLYPSLQNQWQSAAA
jgi:hypothetical protein